MIGFAEFPCLPLLINESLEGGSAQISSGRYFELLGQTFARRCLRVFDQSFAISFAPIHGEGFGPGKGWVTLQKKRLLRVPNGDVDLPYRFANCFCNRLPFKIDSEILEIREVPVSFWKQFLGK